DPAPEHDPAPAPGFLQVGMGTSMLIRTEGTGLSADNRTRCLRQRLVFAALLCIMCGCAPGARGVDSGASVTPTVIGLERTRCFGLCPVYTVTVTSAGAAYFATDASA